MHFFVQQIQILERVAEKHKEGCSALNRDCHV